ncbi:hypothetical protein [Actinoplanes sp. NPDC051411]|uniref:hypothetical protein n=1 Tax=Actinoplanes sp. NPDC051411 TaxID=3155522 RepID=UPI00341F814D
MIDKRGHLIGIVSVVVALAVVAFSFALPSLRGDDDGARTGPALASDPGDSPFVTASKMLDAQARALIAGDEDGWLAAVDPGQPQLRTTYRQMYVSLRALDVTQFRYRPLLLGSETDPALSIDGKIAYCFTDCSVTGGGGVDPPDAHQHLTVKTVGKRPVITDMVQYAQDDHLAPAPWETGPLVFKRGPRVTVAAPPSEAGYLDNVLSIAERGAAVADRYAAAVGNQQRRYRIYLADKAGWTDWYGRSTEAGVAYTMPLPGSGADVVVRIDEIGKDKDSLSFIVRSQLGEVVALGQQLDTAADYSGADTGWLSDGVANWIGSSPDPARTGPWAADVHTLMHSGHAPKSIVQPQLTASTPEGKVRASFGLAQFAVDCLVTKYGEAAFFAFAKGVLQEQLGPDIASVSAFHQPFSQVDKGCMTWIRGQVA